MHHLSCVGDLHTEFQLIVQLVRQSQSITLIGFDYPRLTTLHMDHVDRKVEFSQILLECSVIVSCLLHENKTLFQWPKGTDTLHEGLEAFTRLFKDESRTTFKALI